MEIKVAIAESIPSNINSIDDIFIKERLHVVESIVTAIETDARIALLHL